MGLFKKGDKVFDYLYGWGEVYDTNISETYTVSVKFNNFTTSYTQDGCLYVNTNPTLSFTEYTLDGFSQERPIELPEIGEFVMVSYDQNKWFRLKVKKIVNGKIVTESRIWNHFLRIR